MGATESRHALRFRANGQVPSVVTGVWLLAVMLAAGPVRADDQGTRPEPPPPAPGPIVKKSYGPYLFFPPGKRTPPRPAVEPGNIALVQPRPRPSYLYFTPGKHTAPPVAVAPVVRPIVPDEPAPARAEERPPAPKAAVASNIPPPRPVKRQSLIFFTPKRGVGAKDRPQPENLPPLPPLPNEPKPVEHAAVEKIPVRVLPAPTRKPQPYLIFQPKSAKVRPGAPPIEKGSSSPSATSELSMPDRIVAIDTPRPRRESPSKKAGSGPAPPAYQVVTDTRVQPATIRPLDFPEFASEGTSVPRSPSRSPSPSPLPHRPLPPATLPPEVVAGARRNGWPSSAPVKTKPKTMDPEPIRLTGATAESYGDTIGPPIPAGLPPLLEDAGPRRSPR